MKYDIVRFEKIDSTNAEAKRLAQAGKQACVVVSDIQTAGRGRLGRSWESASEEGLWMSILLRPQISPQVAGQITLVTALALCRALEKLTFTKKIDREEGLSPQIKWPNDIILSGKKVCGILTEMSLKGMGIDYLVVGIGVNVNQTSFPEELRDKATSLKREWNKEFSKEQLLQMILEECFRYYDVFLENQGIGNLKEPYEERLINRNRPVLICEQGMFSQDANGKNGDEIGEKEVDSDSGEKKQQRGYTGIARGITDTGELLVETEQGMVAVNAGEVSVRGVYGYV